MWQASSLLLIFTVFPPCSLSLSLLFHILLITLPLIFYFTLFLILFLTYSSSIAPLPHALPYPVSDYAPNPLPPPLPYPAPHTTPYPFPEATLYLVLSLFLFFLLLLLTLLHDWSLSFSYLLFSYPCSLSSSSRSSLPCFSPGYLLFLLLHSVLAISFPSPHSAPLHILKVFCSSLSCSLLFSSFTSLLLFLASQLPYQSPVSTTPVDNLPLRGQRQQRALLFASISRNIRTKLNRSSWA